MRDLVGTASEPTVVTWDERDVMLYALGVGAGACDPTAELHLTTENSAGHALRPLPTFAGSLLLRARPPWRSWGTGPVVHASHTISLTAPLPGSGTATAQATIEAVHDRGSGAMVVTRAVALSPDGAPLCTVTNAAFVVGGGGVGGESGPDEAPPLPTRPPDGELAVATAPNQALLFRLSGDRNRLHSDPEVARAAGFDRPILHGLATSGIAVRVLVGEVCAGDPDLVREVSVRFTAPVTPGERLTVTYWRESTGTRFQVHGETGRRVIDRGLLRCVGEPHSA